MNRVAVRLFALWMLCLCAFDAHCKDDTHSVYSDKGKRLLASKKVDDAAEQFWLATIHGSTTSVAELSNIYNQWTQKASYNWSIPEKYLQQAADAVFAKIGKTSQRYDGCFFVIATENAIVQRLGIDAISQKYMWGGNRRCQDALSNLYKVYYAEGRNGKYLMRAKNYGTDLGNVAIIDRKTALEQFQFAIPPTVDWVVYVKSPANPQTLIPFEIFHRYVYESKMGAFSQLCSNLGAVSASVYYNRKDKATSNQEIQVEARSVVDYGSAKAQISKATESVATEYANSQMTFTGSRVVCKSRTSWLDSEPTWQALQENRLNPINTQTEWTATFHYTDDYMVNIKTKSAFEKAGVKIGLGTEQKFQNFTEIRWAFHVSFAKSLIRIPIERVIE